MTRVQWTDGAIHQFRVLQSEGAIRPFERLDPHGQSVYDEPTDVITNGWQLKGYPRISVQPPIPWDEVASENRSWEFNLQRWDFLAPVLSRLSENIDEELLDFAVSVAEDWAAAFPTIDVPSRMAWYDMAIGLRAHRLAFIVDVAARQRSIADDRLARLLASVETHQQAFRLDAVFKPHSNHGFYVAAGQCAMSRRLSVFPGMADQAAQAHDRLRQMLAVQFTSEGVHREHSPYYHRMILDTVRNLHHSGLLAVEERPTIEEMEDALAWFVLPNGNLATFGDSRRRAMPLSDAYMSHALKNVTSRGRVGRPPAEQWRAFPESGYAVFRGGWPAHGEDSEDWTYLAFNAAFHSRTHKHADDLSFIWYDRGQEILIDPGRFGYIDPTSPDSELAKQGFYYGHPSRVYVEETRAHNAVEIDSRSYQRRGVEPYGSGLTRTGSEGGVFYAEGSVEHLTIDRSSRVVHSRLLLASPGEWLIVYDALSDPRNRPHDYRQWFQFDPSLTVIADDLGWSTELATGSKLWGLPLLDGRRSVVFNGATEPRLQGWVSLLDNELEPTPSVCVEAEATPSAGLATLFWFGDDPPLPGRSSVGDEHLVFQWSAATDHVVAVDLAVPDRIKVQLTLAN